MCVCVFFFLFFFFRDNIFYFGGWDFYNSAVFEFGVRI